MTDVCSRCQWWEMAGEDDLQDGNETPGRCNRFPPQRSDAMHLVVSLYMTAGDEEIRTVSDWQTLWEHMTKEDVLSNYWRPLTGPNEFCGEFKQK